jgi:hypothetical protein
MVSTRLSTVNNSTDWNRDALINFYGTNATLNWDMYGNDTDNNGNLRRQVYYVPDNDAITAHAIPELHDFSYDALNRVTSVTESHTSYCYYHADGRHGWRVAAGLRPGRSTVLTAS